MTRRIHLSDETRKQLCALLLNDMTPTQAAMKLKIHRGQAVLLRKYLVNSGALKPLRRRRKVASLSKITTPSVITAPTTQSALLQFRVNDVEFIFYNSKRVIVENGIVDIKY